MKIVLAVFSVVYCIAVIWNVIRYEQGKAFQQLNNLNPVGVFIGEVLAVVTAILVLVGAIIGVIRLL